MTQQFGQGFEGLEERTLLAANVTATLVGDTLVVTGDATANDISVHGTGVAGAVEVSILGVGQTLAVDGGVTVDATNATFTGVNNIVVRGNDGNDSINVYDVNIAGNVTENGGLGDDTVQLSALEFDTYVGGGVVLNGGRGNDGVFIQTQIDSINNITTAGGAALVNTGGTAGMAIHAQGTGDISIGGYVLMNEFSGAGAYGSAEIISDGLGEVLIGGGVLMNGGIGDDSLGIQANVAAAGGGVSIGAGVVMNGGWGNDEEFITANGVPATNLVGNLVTGNAVNINGDVSMVGGVDDDELSVTANGGTIGIGGSAYLFGNLGSDRIVVEGVGLIPGAPAIDIQGNFLAVGDDGNFFNVGNNFIELSGAAVHGGALILAGNGDDGIDIDNNTIGQDIWVFGQFGNDTICFENNTVNGSAALFGSLGTDGAHVAGNTIGGFLFELGIETNLAVCPFDTVLT